MNRSTLLWLGVLGVGGYLLYRWAQQTVASAAPNLQPAGNPASVSLAQPTLLNAVTQGMQSGINAGTYNAQDLRMQPESTYGMAVADPTGGVINMVTDPGSQFQMPALPAYTGPITAAQMAGWGLHGT